jgi:hypothetical protein
MGIVWILRRSGLEVFARLNQVAFQKLMIAEVVEDRWRIAHHAHDPAISAVSEIKAPQPIIRCCKAQPGIDAVFIGLDGAPVILLRQTVIAITILQLGKV